MSGHRSHRLLPWLAALVALLWSGTLLVREDAMLVHGGLDVALSQAALIATGALVVMALAELLLHRALRGAEREPSGFVRALVYLALTFFAGCLALLHLGYNVPAVLATSTIVTAAVGLALQPTLGGVIGGLVINADRLVRVGDHVRQDGQWVEVTDLGWRSIVATSGTGRIVVIPNARLSDHVTEVVRAREPVMIQFNFRAEVAERPERVAQLVASMVTDLPLVDRGSPVKVIPLDYNPTSRSLRYGVRFWITDPSSSEAVLGEAHRRLWYVFQRNGLTFPTAEPRETVRDTTVTPDTLMPMLESALAENASQAHAMAKAGAVLIFATGERLVAPDRVGGAQFLIIQGAADASVPGRHSDAFRFDPAGRAGQLHRIAVALARHVGPYADFAVRRVARQEGDLDTLCQTVSLEIDAPEARAAFLAEMSPRPGPTASVGAWLTAHFDAAGLLVCGDGLRARTETILLAVPAVAAAERHIGRSA